MPETIRFHLDESVDLAVGIGLRRLGVDTTAAQEVGLKGAADEEQLRFAVSQDRVLVTHDRDFLVLDSRGIQHSGIAYCHVYSRTIGDLIRTLKLIWGDCEPAELRGKVEYL